VQAVLVSPPLDVRARQEGFNAIYRLMDLEIPFIYSSLHATSRTLRERPEIIQRVVAGLAETILYAERNPAKTKAAITKYMRVKDEEPLEVAYTVYTKEIVDRQMLVPPGVINDTVERLRSQGTAVKRRPEDLYDNSFVDHLEKSGFLKSLWGK
jgi:ABC-type nitrate/sulfonate/bicarbonate transport system substrate-binding protein